MSAGVHTKVGILDGVDIKAEGGYVMMSPSIHPSGKRYMFAEPRYAVPGILPEDLNILAGRPKCDKSMPALNLCLAVVFGGKALGKIDVQKGAALYLALEDIHPHFSN